MENIVSVESKILHQLEKRLKNENLLIVCVGAGSFAKLFLNKCRLEYPNIFEKIIYLMDDFFSDNTIVEKKVIKIEKIEKNVIYIVLTKYEDARVSLMNKLLYLGIEQKNIISSFPKFELKELICGSFDILDFNIIECGARGDTPQVDFLKTILSSRLIIHAFEADKKEREKLLNRYEDYNVYENIIDFKKNNKRKMYNIDELGSWTFHEPNMKLHDRYTCKFGSSKQKVCKTEIFKDTTTLDIVINDIKKQIDYLYINIDSAEFYALKGAKKSLTKQKINVLEVEVYFNEWYKNQPLFSDVDIFMRQNGYELLTLRKPNNIIPISAPFKCDGEKLLHMNAIYINKNNFEDRNNILRKCVILELLNYPLKAFSILGELYIKEKMENSKESEKIKKILEEAYIKYSEEYESYLSFDEFIRASRELYEYEKENIDE